MERAFREDIKNADGDVKFPAGVFYEWPKATFVHIVRSLGKSLEDATVGKVEAGQVFKAKQVVEPRALKGTGKPPSAKAAANRVRLMKEAHNEAT